MLDDACAAVNISPELLFDEIEVEESAQTSPPIDWNRRPLVELLHHLVTHYHEPERTTLQHLVHLAKLATQTNDGPTKTPIQKLSGEVRALAEELLRHMAKEEQILFPWIASGRGSQAAAPITAMLRDHRDTIQTLARLRKLANNFRDLDNQVPRLTELYTQLATFDRDIRDHIHLENNVLFPRALRETT